jgi:hypothetical protein
MQEKNVPRLVKNCNHVPTEFPFRGWASRTIFQTEGDALFNIFAPIRGA